jgi:hypothetical protein
MILTATPATTLIGTLLARAIVPLWVLTGALFKLVERTPGNLPPTLRQFADQMNVGLGPFLRTAIALEFLAVGVMLFLPRLSRAMAIFMLTSFCAILINEVRLGTESCGCMGKLKVDPLMMLAIDGALLLGVLLFPTRGARRLEDGAAAPTWPIVAALAWVAAGFGAAFGVPEKAATIQQAITDAPPDDPTVNPKPDPLPSYYSPDEENWVGKPWREAGIFRLMTRWPAGLDEGVDYVIFYSKTCDHCHALLETHFTGELAIPTTAVGIPAMPGAEPEEALEMPCERCALMSLPEGCEWFITAPILMRIENGIIQCATEGESPDAPACLASP